MHLLSVARTEKANEEDLEEKTFYEVMTTREHALREVIDGLPMT